MRALASLGSATLFLLAATSASAQYGIPVQGPQTGSAGTFTLAPTIGVLHERSFTDLSLAGRARFTVIDRLLIGAHAGAVLGDLNAFALGLEAKYAVLDSGSGPLDLSPYVVLDTWFGDTTQIGMLAGALAGTSLKAGDVWIEPYGGAGVGFGHTRISTPFGSGGNTEVSFALIAGSGFAFTESLAVFIELGLGFGDGLPILNLHFGVPLRF